MYKVFDSLGNYLRIFNSYQAASEFKGPRYDWTISKTVLSVCKKQL